MKFIKGLTLAYWPPAQYDNFSHTEENQESKIANISAANSKTKTEILQGIPSNSN